MVNYIDAPGGVGGAEGISWAYWDWNPTSGDTGGILENDWSTVDETKMAAITPALYHAGSGTTAVSPSVVDFVVQLSTASTTAVTVDYHTADGTAKAGVNYVAESGTITFAPGETTAIVVDNLLGTSAVTSELTFMLDLSSPSGASLATTQATAVLMPASSSSSGGSGSTSTSTGSGSSTGSGGGSGTAVAGGGGSTTSPVTVLAHTTQSWTGGFLENLTVENNSSVGVSAWEVEVTMPGTITNLWNAVALAHTGNTYILGSADYDADITAHGSITIGFQASGSSSDPLSAVLFKLS